VAAGRTVDSVLSFGGSNPAPTAGEQGRMIYLLLFQGILTVKRKLEAVTKYSLPNCQLPRAKLGGMLNCIAFNEMVIRGPIYMQCWSSVVKSAIVLVCLTLVHMASD
jgi:hypothetical protein